LLNLKNIQRQKGMLIVRKSLFYLPMLAATAVKAGPGGAFVGVVSLKNNSLRSHQKIPRQMN
jgi:hypothetical protein